MGKDLGTVQLGTEKPARLPGIHLPVTLAIAISLLILAFAAVQVFSLLRAASLTYGMSPAPPPLPLRIYSRLFQHKIVTTNFWIQARSGPIEIRMLTPQDLPNAPIIVVVHGFAPIGNQDKLLNTLAERLCRLGLRVVMPNIVSEELAQMSVTAIDDVDDVVRWSTMTSSARVSLFGISYSGGMVISAAAVPEFADDVKMVFCVAGYNSIDRLGRYYLHDDVRAPDQRPYREIPPVGALGPMALQYMDELVSPNDVEPMRMALLNKSPQPLTARQHELLEDLLSVKTQDMRTRYHALLEHHRTELATISPMGKINHLHGSLYVLHGSLDATVPKGEAEWTQQEASPKGKLKILITPWLHHAVLDFPATLREKLRVEYFISQMLDAALQPSPLPAPRH
jgi:alpha/beta superfamily hydrolase